MYWDHRLEVHHRSDVIQDLYSFFVQVIGAALSVHDDVCEDLIEGCFPFISGAIGPYVCLALAFDFRRS